MAEEKKQEAIRLAEEKRREAARIAEEGKVFQITPSQFSDNISDIIDKNIVVEAWYSHAGNAGAWSDVSGMTLRSKGDTFEDLYSVYNFSYTQSDGARDNYRRRVEIDGNKVNLIIPKSISNNMPNTTASNVAVYGKVLRYDLILVKKIVRLN